MSLKKIFQYVRQDLDLTGQSRAPPKLPDLLTDAELTRFYEVLLQGANPVHVILVKMLLFAGFETRSWSEASSSRTSTWSACRCVFAAVRAAPNREVPVPRDSVESSCSIWTARRPEAPPTSWSLVCVSPTRAGIRQILKTYADQARMRSGSIRISFATSC